MARAAERREDLAICHLPFSHERANPSSARSHSPVVWLTSWAVANLAVAVGLRLEARGGSPPVWYQHA